MNYVLFFRQTALFNNINIIHNRLSFEGSNIFHVLPQILWNKLQLIILEKQQSTVIQKQICKVHLAAAKNSPKTYNEKNTSRKASIT